MKYRIIIALFVLGFCADVFAADKQDFPRVSFISRQNGKSTATRDQFLILVVEGPYISYETNPIPSPGEVDYVNNLLKIKGVSYIGIHVRDGVKYGDVVRAIDLLRKTNATDIGVSMILIPPGRNP